MRKIEAEHENPFDNLLYLIVETITPTLYKWNFTPNIITSLSLITTIISLYYFDKKQNNLGILFLIISYFFDCEDGYFARKYNMVTEYGDYYDHLTDFFLTIGLIYQLYKQNSYKNFKIKFGIFVLFSSLMMVHFGCQEHHYKNNESPSLAYSKYFCLNKKWIKYTKFFGSGTLMFIMCCLFYFEFGKT